MENKITDLKSLLIDEHEKILLTLKSNPSDSRSGALVCDYLLLVRKIRPYDQSLGFIDKLMGLPTLKQR